MEGIGQMELKEIISSQTSCNSVYCSITIIHLSVKAAYNWLSAKLALQRENRKSYVKKYTI